MQILPTVEHQHGRYPNMENSLSSCASQELTSVSGSFTPVNQREFHNSTRTSIVVFLCAFMQDAWLILELHDKALHCIPPKRILPGDYYAVDYVKNYYFGRVLEASKSSVKFKFLQKVGTSTFDWHKRDDIDSSHTSCIYFGPVNLRYNKPFKIEKEAVVEKVQVSDEKVQVTSHQFVTLH